MKALDSLQSCELYRAKALWKKVKLVGLLRLRFEAFFLLNDAYSRKGHREVEKLSSRFITLAELREIIAEDLGLPRRAVGLNLFGFMLKPQGAII